MKLTYRINQMVNEKSNYLWSVKEVIWNVEKNCMFQAHVENENTTHIYMHYLNHKTITQVKYLFK